MTKSIQTANRSISRAVKRVLKAQATQDGAGVSKRVPRGLESLPNPANAPGASRWIGIVKHHGMLGLRLMVFWRLEMTNWLA